jgi:hypothetical protein
MAVHLHNWYFGWALLLSGFATGAVIGLFFHREDFLGGYTSFRRRIIRLGHISQAALGIVNALYGISPWPESSLWEAQAAGVCWMIGGIAMPAVCYLTGWKEQFRCLFFIPVVSLSLAAVYTLQGGP